MKELNNNEIEVVSGGSDEAMTLATGWAGTVSGFGIGAVIGGPVGGAIGGAIGFAVGSIAGIAYSNASDTSGESGSGRYRSGGVAGAAGLGGGSGSSTGYATRIKRH